VTDVDDVIPMLLDACPSALPAWEAYRTRWAGADTGGHYPDIGVVNRHAVQLLSTGRSAELRALFSTVEEMFAGTLTPDAHELMTVGLLEGIQNNAMHDEVGLSGFIAYLGPLTHLEWIQLHFDWGTTDS
jgi:hypothetical protein